MYSVVFKYEQGNMNSVQNEAGQRYGMLVWFEGVYHDHDGDEKGDDDDGGDNIGDVDVNDDDDDNRQLQKRERTGKEYPFFSVCFKN